jgi:polyisoprenoid-binding protein YceI
MTYMADCHGNGVNVHLRCSIGPDAEGARARSGGVGGKLVTRDRPREGAADSGTLAELFDGGAKGNWVLDVNGPRAEFAVRHFWGAITVRGRFEQVQGEGTMAEDGSVNGGLTIEAASLTTKNPGRDRHLRSAEFFDVVNHPSVFVRVTGVARAHSGGLAITATLEAAGRSQPLRLTARVLEVSPNAITLAVTTVVDRTAFGMTWSPLGMASSSATLDVVTRFVRC